MTHLLDRLRAPRLPDAPALPAGPDGLLGALLFAFGLFLPHSVAGTNILEAMLLLFALAALPRVWRAAPWREPVVACGLLLFAYITLHTFATAGSTAQALEIVKRYDELPLLAALVALLRMSTRSMRLFQGLAVGAVGLAAAYWAAPHVPALAAKTQSGYISAGLTLGLSAWLLMELAPGSRRPALFHAAAAFLAVTLVLRVPGRTGLVILALLGASAAFNRLPRRWRLAGAVLIPVALVGLSMKIGAASDRLRETANVLSQAPSGENNSTRIRIEMLTLGVDLARDHALAGVGLGNYAEANRRAAEARELRLHGRVGPEQPWTATENPHNEYLYQLAGGGIVALALFLAWLLLPMVRRIPGQPHALLLVPALAFALGCTFNSMLRDFIEAHFYVGLLAWVLAGGPGRQVDGRAAG